MILTRPFSAGARIMVPRWLRICLLERLIMPCRLPDWAERTLPPAVILKRFLQDDLFFILGILLPSWFWGRVGSALSSIMSRHGMPCRAAQSSRFIRRSSAKRKIDRNGYLGARTM